MSSFTLFAAATVLSMLALLEANRRGSRRGEWVLKPLTAAGFLAAAVAAGAFESRFGRVVFAGLALSFCGDVLLIPRTRLTFVSGLGAFLLGHVAYAAAFLIRGVAGPETLVALGTLALPALAVCRWLLPSVERSLVPPVLAYVVVITGMVALAAGTVARHGNPWLLVGAVAFFVSDLSVARDRFIATGFVNKTWGWPLYFGAQLVLAWCSGRP